MAISYPKGSCLHIGTVALLSATGHETKSRCANPAVNLMSDRWCNHLGVDHLVGDQLRIADEKKTRSSMTHPAQKGPRSTGMKSASDY